jgi:hypothetical protein
MRYKEGHEESRRPEMLSDEPQSVSPMRLCLSAYVLLLRVTWLLAKYRLRSIRRKLRGG